LKSLKKIVFITGCGRSGTTILENILNCHPEIAEWYEPYYLWERYFSVEDNDIWPERCLTEAAGKAIYKEFERFSRKSKKPIVLDKSPYHTFNISIINKIFPDAKWIHIVRDGRDVTLSLRKEWMKRRRIVEQKDYYGVFSIAFQMLQRQPFLRYKLMALFHEIREARSVDPRSYLNKSRWKGVAGYGPRFKGWKTYPQRHTPLEFNAMQWVQSVKAVRRDWCLLPEKNRIEIKYEALLQHPEQILSRVLSFIDVDIPPEFFDSIPKLRSNSFHKWEKEFTSRELLEIKPIVSPILLDLSYIRSIDW
jgi:hypothetical protein